MREHTKPIRAVVIHCTATPGGRPHTIDDIRRWHMARGWSDVGYHWLIHLDGTISKGRDMRLMGAHTRGHNNGTIGIAYVGGIDAETNRPGDTRSPLQKLAIERLLDQLALEYGEVQADGFRRIAVHGHNQFNPAKACPSFDVKAEYGDLWEVEP